MSKYNFIAMSHPLDGHHWPPSPFTTMRSMSDGLHHIPGTMIPVVLATNARKRFKRPDIEKLMNPKDPTSAIFESVHMERIPIKSPSQSVSQWPPASQHSDMFRISKIACNIATIVPHLLEQHSLDGTPAHTLERLACASAAGMRSAIPTFISDDTSLMGGRKKVST